MMEEEDQTNVSGPHNHMLKVTIAKNTVFLDRQRTPPHFRHSF
jgi:hypothetical protein